MTSRAALFQRLADGLRECASAVDALAAECAREEHLPSADIVYGSRAPYEPPPEKSHRWMRDHGPELVAFGATRRGGTRGASVFWLISAEGWARYRASLAKPLTKPVELAPVIRPTAWIRAAGARPTRTADPTPTSGTILDAPDPNTARSAPPHQRGA